MSPVANINNDLPSYTNPAYDEMADRWELVKDVYNGTEAMRAFYETYLTKSPAETGDEFKARASTLEMFPAFKQTVDGLTGVAFRVEPRLDKDVPQIIRDHAENIDGQGTHLVVFGKELFRDAMRDGHGGIFIDAPVVEAPLTRGQEIRAGVRPYWIQVFPENVLSWRVGMVNGVLTLTQLVFQEVSEEPDGLFTNTTVVRYRKYRREEDGRISFRVWDQSQVDNWNDATYDNPLQFGFLTNQTEIPFVVCYAGTKLGPLVSRPGLLDLAYANVIHMNVVSDRRNGLHSAMHPILVFKGRRRRAAAVNQAAGKGEDDEQFVGPNIGIDLPADPNANVFYAEHQGKALGEGRLEIQDIEKRMAAMGLAMLQNDTRAAETAEAKRIDKDEKTANLSSAVRSWQDAMELALAFHANYLRLPTGGSMLVNRDFEQKPLDPAMITALSNMVANGQLSTETLWQIMQKFAVLPEDMDFELEIAKIVAGGQVVGQGPPPPPSVPQDKANGDTGTQPVAA